MRIHLHRRAHLQWSFSGWTTLSCSLQPYFEFFFAIQTIRILETIVFDCANNWCCSPIYTVRKHGSSLPFCAMLLCVLLHTLLRAAELRMIIKPFHRTACCVRDKVSIASKKQNYQIHHFIRATKRFSGFFFLYLGNF